MFEESRELQELAEQVISEHGDLQHIADDHVRIVYLYSDQEKKSKGKPVCADTEKVADKIRSLLPCDFIITFYERNCEELSMDKMRMLMRHELKHVGYDPEKDRCYLVPHDVEDFRDMIEEYGLDWMC